MIKKIGFFVLLSFFLNCSGDKVRLRYSVSCNGFCDIFFSVRGNFPSSENRSGNWNRNFRVEPGSPYFISVTPTGAFSSATVSIYINKELYRTETTNVPFSTALLEGLVPE
jgi:hypothetical protein